MSEESYIPFSGLVSELRRVSEAGKTGIFFIATRANRSAQLMMVDGRIIYLYFFNKRGKEGLKQMAQIKAGRFRFQEGPVNAKPMDLPSTGEILAFLDSVSSGAEAEPHVEAMVPVPDPAPEPAPAVASADGLSDGQKGKLEELLAIYIGPMAAIICEDHLDGAVGLDHAIEALASEIPSAEQADSFRARARKEMG